MASGDVHGLNRVFAPDPDAIEFFFQKKVFNGRRAGSFKRVVNGMSLEADSLEATDVAIVGEQKAFCGYIEMSFSYMALGHKSSLRPLGEFRFDRKGVDRN
ncbi:unnamed protein product [Sphagnum jensenii]|uniref:Uncharacterized protein n=1 Tax=Sphagnum jensenii TaxID=128206 RepID=A0ABP0VF26_9BRYO